METTNGSFVINKVSLIIELQKFLIAELDIINKKVANLLKSCDVFMQKKEKILNDNFISVVSPRGRKIVGSHRIF